MRLTQGSTAGTSQLSSIALVPHPLCTSYPFRPPAGAAPTGLPPALMHSECPSFHESVSWHGVVDCLAAKPSPVTCFPHALAVSTPAGALVPVSESPLAPGKHPWLPELSDLGRYDESPDNGLGLLSLLPSPSPSIPCLIHPHSALPRCALPHAPALCPPFQTPAGASFTGSGPPPAESKHPWLPALSDLGGGGRLPATRTARECRTALSRQPGLKLVRESQGGPA